MENIKFFLDRNLLINIDKEDQHILPQTIFDMMGYEVSIHLSDEIYVPLQRFFGILLRANNENEIL